MITVVGAMGLLASLPLWEGFAGAAAPAVVADHFSAVGRFRTSDGWYASPIHASVLVDGQILFIGVARPTDPPTGTERRRVAWLFTPPPIGTDPEPDTVINEITEPIDFDKTPLGDQFVSDDLYCTISALDADGRLITAGGARAVSNADGSTAYTLGMTTQSVLDETGWRTLAGQMVGNGIFGSPGRWYPTLTRLPDKRMLVTGGVELITSADVGYSNRTIETLDPATGARALFSDRNQTPEAIQARDYTHVFVLPYATGPVDLLLFGETATPVYGDSATPGSLTTVGAPRPGGGGAENWGASSSMLPLRVGNGEWGYTNGSVLIASGDMGTPLEHRADIYDVTGSWKPSLELDAMRHHPSTVLLPDSRTLIINGHDVGGDPRVQQAQYVDPAANFAVSWGASSSGVVRGYHSIAVALPDGRVLVGGGRDMNTKTSLEKPTYQIYSPDYMAAVRPSILSAPTTVAYGSLFTIGSDGPPPKEVQLMALGSMTHSFDTGQRSIQLAVGQVFTNAEGRSLSVIGAPDNSHVATPGYYWLYVLDANRIPSEGRLVHVG